MKIQQTTYCNVKIDIDTKLIKIERCFVNLCSRDGTLSYSQGTDKDTDLLLCPRKEEEQDVGNLLALILHVTSCSVF